MKEKPKKMGINGPMKKGILALLIMLIASTTIFARADTEIDCYYWYSSGNNVGFWAQIPTITYNKLNSSSTFYFLTSYNHARSEWNNAEVSTMNGGSGTSGNIVCYGGTYEQIYNETNRIIPSSDTGLTVYSNTFCCNLHYVGGNQTKYLYTVNSGTVFIVDNNRTADQYKKTFTHELGHALGWFGHSSVSSDIMYSTASSITTLTNRDKLHLNQFY